MTSTGSVGPASSAPRVTGVRWKLFYLFVEVDTDKKEHHFACWINLCSSDCDLYEGVSGART